MKFRASADRVLARERAAGPAPDRDETAERRGADESKQAEREATDALLERERGGVDARTDARRRQQDCDRAEHLAQRQDTDERLVEERNDADANLVALADSNSERARSAEVLAMVTHDLRSPLSVIMAASEFIVDATKEAETREVASDVSCAAGRMGRLLTDLLDVARIESGTFGIVKGRHDVGALLADVLHAYGPLFAQRDVTLKVELPAAPLIASFDHDRVVQLLSNLLANSMKFTPPEGHVELRAEHDGSDLKLVLRDTGPGIPPDAMPHLFDRFWKRDDDARRGLGLGLYICKNIVEAHGGQISAESERGQGTTFRVALPAA